ncbi:MAG: proteasome activator [Nitriliruptoraceae bacterium]
MPRPDPQPSGSGQRPRAAHAGEETTPGAGSEPTGQEGAPRGEVEEPARLVRIAATVQALLHEVQTTELDQAARERLTEIHNRMVSDLGEIVSDELSQELHGLALEPTEGTPSGAELSVMQAQLAGWLLGLFHGIQASIATQQMAAQQQLARMRSQQAEGLPSGQPGQYL